MRIGAAALAVRPPRTPLVEDDSVLALNEIQGKPYKKITLSNGLVIELERIGSNMVSQAQIDAVLAAISLIPKEDIATLVASHIPIHLLPVAHLEDGVIGATTIVQDSGSTTWRPTLVRIAVEAKDSLQPTGEIVQHEIGHVIAVLQRQDRSEAAAITYAKRY